MNHHLKWSSEEEQLLRKLGASEKKNKWTLIAKTINDEIPGFRKTAKQCRQKYNNHLMFSESHDLNWSKGEEEQLFKQYAQKGSKWKLLSESFPTKSQNTIKNKFYGNVRKIVRKLNKVAKQKINKSLKPIRQKSIIRIIQPQLYTNETPQQIISSMKTLRVKILDLLYKCNTAQLNLQNQSQLNPLDYQYIINIIKEIHLFNSHCRFYTFKKPKSKANPHTSARRQENSQDSGQNNDEQQNQSKEEQLEEQNIELMKVVRDGQGDKEKSLNNCVNSTQNELFNQNEPDPCKDKKDRLDEQNYQRTGGQNRIFFSIQKYLYEYCSFHDQELLPLFQNNKKHPSKQK